VPRWSGVSTVCHQFPRHNTTRHMYMSTYTSTTPPQQPTEQGRPDAVSVTPSATLPENGNRSEGGSTETPTVGLALGIESIERHPTTPLSPTTHASHGWGQTTLPSRTHAIASGTGWRTAIGATTAARGGASPNGSITIRHYLPSKTETRRIEQQATKSKVLVPPESTEQSREIGARADATQVALSPCWTSGATCTHTRQTGQLEPASPRARAVCVREGKSRSSTVLHCGC
jgi:hypothetical protein